jgi:hypothetical protein
MASLAGGVGNMGAHQKRQWIRVTLWRTYVICGDSEGRRGKSVLKRGAVGLYILCDRGALETQSLSHSLYT